LKGVARLAGKAYGLLSNNYKGRHELYSRLPSYLPHNQLQ